MRHGDRRYSGWKFLYSPRWLGYYAMLVIFAVACVLLSNWQFDRREEARQEIQRIENNYDAEPVPLQEAVPDLTYFDEDTFKWQPVTVHGRYVGDPVLIRNRPGAGGVGSDIAQAFLTDRGTVFFVNRGWVDVTADDPEGEDLPVAPDGQETTIVARLRASEPTVPGRTSVGHTAGSMHVSELVRVAGVEQYEAYAETFGMLVSEEAAYDNGRLPAKPEKDEGFHLSYALQWLVFIVIAGVGVGYAARQEFRNFNLGSDRVQEMDDKREKRKKRRGLTDAEQEDAWIDAHMSE